MSEPVIDNHNDLFNIEVSFENITKQLTTVEIPLTGFDSQNLGKYLMIRL